MSIALNSEEIEEESQIVKDKSINLTDVVLQHKSTARLFIKAINCSIGMFLLGYFAGVLNLAYETVSVAIDIPENQINFYEGLLSALFPLGASIGSTFSTVLYQKLSRRSSIFLTDLLTIIGCLIVLFQNLPSFIIARFISGFISGINSNLVAIYITEISPPSISGMTGSLSGIMLALGITCSYFFGLGYNEKPSSKDKFWLIAFEFPIISSLIRSLVIYFFYKLDTPFYYISRQKIDEAKKAILEIYAENSCQKALDQMWLQYEEAQKKNLKFTDIFRKPIRKKLLFSISLHMLMILCGIEALIFFSNSFFLKATHGNISTSYWLSIGFSFTQVFSSVAFTFVIKYMGRRTNLLWGTILCAIFQFIIGILAIVQTQHSNFHSSYEIITISCIYCFSLMYGMSLGSVIWFYVSEIAPDQAVAFATQMNWLSSMFVTFTFPQCREALGLGPCFCFFGTCCLIGFIIIKKYAIETKGLTITEIELKFANK